MKIIHKSVFIFKQRDHRSLELGALVISELVELQGVINLRGQAYSIDLFQFIFFYSELRVFMIAKLIIQAPNSAEVFQHKE